MPVTKNTEWWEQLRTIIICSSEIEYFYSAIDEH